MVSPAYLAVATLGCSVAALTCAWRVYSRGLLPVYPAFFAYLGSQSIVLAAFTLTGATSPLYAWIYTIGLPVTCVVYCLMVRELYAKIFSGYPGIAMFGRWSIYLAVLVALLASFASRSATRQTLASTKTLLVLFESIDRGIVFCLAVLILFLVLVVSRYPLELHQNVVMNCLFFSFVLLVEAASLLVEHLTSLRMTVQIDAVVMLFDACCFAFWAYLLSREGETRTFRFRHDSGAGHERRLLGQLDALNGIVLRASRK